MDRGPSTSGGIGFFGLLAIVFIALKLCGSIDWSWWLVLGPLWMPAAVILGGLALFLVIFVVAVLIKAALGR